MEEKILEVIREALPEKEVGIVRKVFVERDDFKSQLEEDNEEIKNCNKKLIEVAKDRDILKTREDENIKKEKELNEKEQKLEKKELKLDITLAQTEARITRECFDKVMQVPIIRKNIQNSISKNRNGITDYDNESKTEEIREE